MTTFVLRIFIFLLLPLLLAGAVVVLDRTASSTERRLEVFLIFLFALGVAGSGISGFFAHFFLSDLVAQSIGWPAGSPFSGTASRKPAMPSANVYDHKAIHKYQFMWVALPFGVLLLQITATNT